MVIKRYRYTWLMVVLVILISGCGGDSPTDSSESTVNNTPIAEISGSLTGSANQPVSLAGSNSQDTDGDTLSYQWSITSKPANSLAVLSSLSAVNTSLTPDLSGNYTVSLVVNDGTVDSQPATITIQVDAANTNQPPVADAGADRGAVVSAVVTLNGSNSSDPESMTLTYHWTMIEKPNGSFSQLSSATDLAPTFTPDLVGEYNITLTVSDGSHTSPADTVIITARNTSAALIANAGANQTVNLGSTVSLSGANRSDGDSLDFTWELVSRPTGSTAALSDPHVIQPTFTADVMGVYEVSLVVSDSTDQSDPVSIIINVLDPRSEQEPNNDQATAQAFADIGLSHPINATRSGANDVDWYQFEAVANQSYVIELFDVAASLATTQGRDCGGWQYGLSLIAYDSSTTPVEIGKQCQPVGAGNVHTILTIDAELTGTYTLQVASNAPTSSDSGNYSIRVLPQYDHVDASWDASQEPNNKRENAFVISLGATNSISSSFEPRKTQYSTNRADVDWYRFEAVEGQSYVIELFDVAASLATTQGRDCSGWRFGLSLIAYDSSTTPVEISKQCQPVGAGNVHTILTIDAELTGTYTLQVASNALTSSDSDNYSIRVLPQYDHVDARWDASQEPNNKRENAFVISLGATNSISSSFEPRKTQYSTNRADVDWYQFEAVANQSYVIELFGVAASLATTQGRDCGGWQYGLSLIAYDSSATPVEIGKQCQPVGAGNVHTILTIDAELTGTYTLQVASNALTSSDSGNYSIRVLPQYDHVDARWDASHEPNNKMANAFVISLGTANSLSSSFEQRKIQYSTNRADVDWYQFEAVANQSYVIELFDVAASLATTQGRDCGGWQYGLSLIAYDSSATPVEIDRQCQSTGSTGLGNVHNRLTITPTRDGVVSIQVASNALNSSDQGDYKIRVVTTP